MSVAGRYSDYERIEGRNALPLLSQSRKGVRHLIRARLLPIIRVSAFHAALTGES